ncbi:sulfatase [Gangjinia marincola]|uniref:Sulfatase n=1 Tax=Gangjinia marincola TaxID=578463 RepID=A0ABP3XV96_9FLAO
MADDQRWDALSIAGNKHIETPFLDKLANQGTYFTNAYVTTSICAVSRASILTGQYARKHGIWGFDKNIEGDQLTNTYPLQLKKHGYTIGFIGKYGVGYELPSKQFDYWKGFGGQGSFKSKDDLDQPIHLTKRIEGQILEFIDLQKDAQKPFSLSVSFKAPHVEGDPGYFLPDQHYDSLYSDNEVATPPTSSSKYFDHFPKEFTQNNVARNRWETRFATDSMQQANIKKYYRLVHGIDQTVGALLKKLKETGLDKNTIIIYSSDNGFYLGEYGFAGKWYGSDPSIRVPLIIYDPKNTERTPKQINQKALNIDIAPTILAMAGTPIPSRMQGKDLTRLIADTTISWRDRFFYEHIWQSSERYYIPSTEGVVVSDKKYMRYFKDKDTANIIFEELYDLKHDPEEKNNLIGKEEFSALEQELKNTYREVRAFAASKE